MNVAVVRFPGSNCDEDLRRAVVQVLKEGAAYAWHKDPELPPCDAVLLPGGFSYGDYLRAGAMAAHAPIMGAVRRFAERGGPVLGICNGFQVLCEAGLLPGALTRNRDLTFLCKDVHVMVEGRPTPFTAALPAGRVLRLPIAHAEGRFLATPAVRAELEQRAQVIFRYVDEQGGEDEAHDPNGSLGHIAGACNPAGNVVGMMPHPERACEAVLGGGSTDGLLIFESLQRFLAGSCGRVDG